MLKKQMKQIAESTSQRLPLSRGQRMELHCGQGATAMLRPRRLSETNKDDNDDRVKVCGMIIINTYNTDNQN